MLRRDPLTREWRAIVGARQARPNLPSTDCPFCVGGLEAPEPYEVRAFENRWPSLVPGEPMSLPTGEDAVAARGACEVILYSPEHDASLGTLGVAGVRRVIDLWADRTRALLSRPEVEYVLVFENRGAAVGATQPHPHGQVYAFGHVPPVPALEAQVAREHGCPICEVDPGDELLVSRAGTWSASVPVAAAYPHELLLAPDEHVAHLFELHDRERDELAELLVDVLGRADRLFHEPLPYMLWIHPGEHLHLHIASPYRSAGVPRYIAAGEVGSGTYFNPVAPEDAAVALREA